MEHHDDYIDRKFRKLEMLEECLSSRHKFADADVERKVMWLRRRRNQSSLWAIVFLLLTGAMYFLPSQLNIHIPTKLHNILLLALGCVTLWFIIRMLETISDIIWYKTVGDGKHNSVR